MSSRHEAACPCGRSRAVPAGPFTKAGEVARLAAIVAELPDGYLRDALTHLAPQFERDVANDVPTFAGLERERRRLEELILGLRKATYDQRTVLASVKKAADEAEVRARDAEHRMREADAAYHKLSDAYRSAEWKLGGTDR